MLNKSLLSPLQAGEQHLQPDQGEAAREPRVVHGGVAAAGVAAQRQAGKDGGAAAQGAQSARPTRRQARAGEYLTAGLPAAW
jgi:hypothetical protein